MRSCWKGWAQLILRCTFTLKRGLLATLPFDKANAMKEDS